MTSRRRNALRRFLALALAGGLGLAHLPSPAQSAEDKTLTLSAAASLTNALKDIGAKFEAQHPGVKLQYNFAASGVLIQQISQGAPVDVFVSADQETMKRGVDLKLIDPTTQRDFTANSLVLIVPSSGGVPVRWISDLVTDPVRKIAIGKMATVPAGRYTQQVLEHHQVWASLTPKFVYADSVRQVLDYVARGEVEAGFVYRTDAAIMPGKVKVVLQSDEHTPIRYPVAVVAESRKKALAKAFTDYLFTPTAQGILQHHGFARP